MTELPVISDLVLSTSRYTNVKENLAERTSKQYLQMP